MTIIEFEIEASPDSLPILRNTHGRNLYKEYLATTWLTEHYDPPDYFNELHAPIEQVKVSQCQDSPGNKPNYLFANILPEHVGTGQQTITNQTLARVIRSRGRPEKDDCGHIIAAKLGGKMVEFNLFPQDKSINRGYYGLSKWWRKGVEKVMLAWLTLPQKRNPCVEFEIILYYEDPNYPDRPNRAKFLITMKMDDKEDEDSDDEEDNNEPVLHPILKGELLNELDLALEDLRESVYEQINWANFQQHFGNCFSLYRKFLKELFQAIIEESGTIRPIPVPLPEITPPPPRGSNTPFSWLDVVPVVGSVRNIVQGVEDAEDGNAIGATANIALGVGGLVLDVISLGSIGSIGRSIVKEGGKQAGKVVTREVVKNAVKEVAVITCRIAVAAKWASVVLQRVIT